jgi:hypothetical protein
MSCDLITATRATTVATTVEVEGEAIAEEGSLIAACNLPG